MAWLHGQYISLVTSLASPSAKFTVRIESVLDLLKQSLPRYELVGAQRSSVARGNMFPIVSVQSLL